MFKDYIDIRDSFLRRITLNPRTKDIEHYIKYIQEDLLYKITLEQEEEYKEYSELSRDPLIFLALSLSNDKNIRQNHKIILLEWHFSRVVPPNNIYSYLEDIMVPNFLNLPSHECIPLLEQSIKFAHKGGWSILPFLNSELDMNSIIVNLIPILSNSNLTYVYDNSEGATIPEFPIRFNRGELDSFLGESSSEVILTDKTVAKAITELIDDNRIARHFWYATTLAIKLYKEDEPNFTGFYNTFLDILKKIAHTKYNKRLELNESFEECCKYIWFNYNITGVLHDMFLQLEWLTDIEEYLKNNLDNRIELVKAFVRELPFF